LARKTGATAEIRTAHLPKARQESYWDASMFGARAAEMFCSGSRVFWELKALELYCIGQVSELYTVFIKSQPAGKSNLRYF